MRRDLVCSATLLAVAGAFFALASRLGQSALADGVGPAGLPLVYAAALAVLAVSIGLGALLQRRRAPGLAAAPASEHDTTAPSVVIRLRRAAGALSIGVAYLVGLPLIGYPIALALALGAMAAYQGERPGVRMILIAIGGSGLFYVLFDTVLGISMPAPWK